ncbi:MAG: eukaryotic-like serine/threonine-protein kinase [Acidobacteriota bacterium]|nr:eukaryotic-like serine/threonine-protein kinase [Acidobacteriota bacterium]
MSADAYWQRVRALFHDASALPADERETFLKDACPDDSDLRTEVRSLLAAHDDEDDFLEPPPRAGGSFVEGDLVAGRYTILCLLGTGGMGEVYQADDRELQEAVALKIIRPEIASNPRILARFKREIQLARRVTHPNVCRIYDVSHHLSRTDAGAEERKISFVSMELLHGRTLAAHLRASARMPTSAVLPILKQLAAGLDAAHAASIVHRDFKSANVMLVPASDGATRAVITDFGLAHETGVERGADGSRLTDSGMLVGTPDYMAPEQLEDGPLTPATDVYALGIVLFEMVTGRLPFDGTTPLSIALSRLQQPAPSPRRWAPDLDPRWEAVILQCLERDPAMRFAHAGDVVAALESSQPLRKPRAPRRTWWPVAVTVLAAATVAVPLILRDREPGFLGVPRSSSESLGTGAATNPSNSEELRGTSVLTPRRAVAVIGFRNLSARPGDAWLANAFAELLTNELSAAEALRIIPGEDVERLRSDLSLREGEALPRPLLDQVRERLGTDVVVSGSYITLAAGALRLDVHLQDTATGKALGTLSESGAEGELFALVSRLGARLRQSLGAVPLTAEATAGLRASRPVNADAARAYVEGLTKLRRFDALGARTTLERAVELEPAYPMAHAALGEALWNLGAEAPAMAEADRALSLATHLDREERLSIEARANVFHKQFDKAIEIYRSLFTFYPDELAYGLRLASTQVSAGKAIDALATVEKLRTLPEPLRADPMIDLVAADAYHLKHDSQNELRVAQRAEATGAASKIRSVVARAKANQSYAHRDLGHTDQGVTLLEDAARIYDEIGDRAGAARCYSNLGLALWNRGDLAAAEPLLERALVIHRQVGSRSFESRTLNNIGMIRFFRGNIDGAEKVWREALVVQRESNFLTAMAPTLSNLGGALQLRGDMAGAEKYYREAIAVSQQTDDRYGELTALVNIGELLRLRGDLAGSVAPYERGLALARELSMPQQEAYTMAAMGDLALWQNNFPEAKRRHTVALQMRKKSNERVFTAQSQVMLANVLLEDGKPQEADALLREAIPVFAKEAAAEDEALAQETRTRVFLALGRPADAQQALERAQTLTRESRTLGLLSAIAATDARLLLAAGKTDAAASRAREAIADAEKSELVAAALDARLVAADIDDRRGRTAAAARSRTAIRDTAQKHGLLLIAAKARSLPIDGR